MIHVCFGLHDKTGRYSKFTGTTMLSLFENTTSEVTVHILHDNTLTQDNRDKFSYLVGLYNQCVKFYNVEELCASEIAEFIRLIPSAKNSWLTIAALYRLLIPKLLSLDIEKAIYLDSDIIVNLDINKLWRIELDEKIFGAVSNVKSDYISYLINKTKKFSNYLITSGLVEHDDYFNSGVLLMNLNILRDKYPLIMNGVKFVGEHPQLIYMDQEILNYLFSKEYLKLPTKFNWTVRDARLEKNARLKESIYHYAGGNLFNLDTSDPFNRLWIKHFINTPWFDEEAIGRLYGSFLQTYNQLSVHEKNSMINLSAVMSGKTRAFFVSPQNVEAIREIFSIRDDEDILLAENQESLIKLLNVMKLSQDKKIFFIMIPNFPFDILTQAGFVLGKDFLNGWEFLSAENGVPMYFYPLIQAM